MDTNYYKSYIQMTSYSHRKLSYNDKGRGTDNLRLDEKNRMNVKLQTIQAKSYALQLLLGGSGFRAGALGSHGPFYPFEDVVFPDYNHLKPIHVKSIQKLTVVDNSGPCTSNTSVDESIDLDAYIARAQAANREYIENAGDEFTFISRENYESVSAAYFAALQEKYTYLYNEAKQHAVPEAYIYDKYNNPDSPYDASDLTENQRQIAYRYEKQMLKDGQISGVYFQDSLFEGKPLNAGSIVGDEKRFDRKVMNSQLGNILKKNGITIPEGVNLRCTVDPKSCRISVADMTGDKTDRQALCEAVEKALNQGKNGLQLYQHIMQSSYTAYSDVSTQYNYEGRIKFQYYHNTDKTSYGMDGDYNEKFAKYCEKYYHRYAEKAAEAGFDGFFDMYLSIDITSTGFHDAFQSVDWSDDQDPSIAEWAHHSAYSTL